jgi:hypothetical protein
MDIELKQRLERVEVLKGKLEAKLNNSIYGFEMQKWEAEN